MIGNKTELTIFQPWTWHLETCKNKTKQNKKIPLFEKVNDERLDAWNELNMNLFCPECQHLVLAQFWFHFSLFLFCLLVHESFLIKLSSLLQSCADCLNLRAFHKSGSDLQVADELKTSLNTKCTTNYHSMWIWYCKIISAQLPVCVTTCRIWLLLQTLYWGISVTVVYAAVENETNLKLWTTFEVTHTCLTSDDVSDTNTFLFNLKKFDTNPLYTCSTWYCCLFSIPHLHWAHRFLDNYSFLCNFHKND